MNVEKGGRRSEQILSIVREEIAVLVIDISSLLGLVSCEV